ncbi:hypothetical protein ACVWV0_004640 [Ewingella americana]
MFYQVSRPFFTDIDKGSLAPSSTPCAIPGSPYLCV